MKQFAMLTALSPDLTQALESGINLAECNEDCWQVLANHLIPLGDHVFMQTISFISVLVRAETEGVFVNSDRDTRSEFEPIAVWDDDNGEFIICLTQQALVLTANCPRAFAMTMLGYAVLNNIPFFSPEWGNLIPEDRLKAKAQEKAEKINEIYLRAASQPTNKALHEQCLMELAALNAPPPPKASLLGRAMERDTPSPRKPNRVHH